MLAGLQKGTTTVEFAVVAVILLTMIFGAIEIGRGYYVFSMLDEVTRRGARLAAVCQVNDSAIPQLAIFNASGDASSSSVIEDLTPENVKIDYLDAKGDVVNTPATNPGFGQIRYVRARIVGYTHRVVVPFVMGRSGIEMPAFDAVLPRESLGIQRDGAITAC